MSNAPDEAEGLLNALDQLGAEENKYAIDGTIADVLAVGLARKMVRDNIIPLIRSGLALQRLEKWQDDGPGRECHREIIDGMVHIRLLVRDKLVAFGVSVTASKAINAALDAAGVE